MSGKIPALIAACVLLLCKSAFAHRIDEYLQATILSLETNRVQASMPAHSRYARRILRDRRYR